MWWLTIKPSTMKPIHKHTLVKYENPHIEYKKVQAQEHAGWDVYVLQYHQSICLECGEKFKYELISQKFLHSITYAGNVIKTGGGVNSESNGKS